MKWVTFYNSKFQKGRVDLLSQIQRSTRVNTSTITNVHQEQSKKIELLEKKVELLETQMSVMSGSFDEQMNRLRTELVAIIQNNVNNMNTLNNGNVNTNVNTNAVNNPNSGLTRVASSNSLPEVMYRSNSLNSYNQQSMRNSSITSNITNSNFSMNNFEIPTLPVQENNNIHNNVQVQPQKISSSLLQDYNFINSNYPYNYKSDYKNYKYDSNSSIQNMQNISNSIQQQQHNQPQHYMDQVTLPTHSKHQHNVRIAGLLSSPRKHRNHRTTTHSSHNTHAISQHSKDSIQSIDQAIRNTTNSNIGSFGRGLPVSTTQLDSYLGLSGSLEPLWNALDQDQRGKNLVNNIMDSQASEIQHELTNCNTNMDVKVNMGNVTKNGRIIPTGELEKTP